MMLRCKGLIEKVHVFYVHQRLRTEKFTISRRASNVFLDKISLLRRPCVSSAMYIPSPLESEVQRF